MGGARARRSAGFLQRALGLAGLGGCVDDAVLEPGVLAAEHRERDAVAARVVVAEDFTEPRADATPCAAAEEVRELDGAPALLAAGAHEHLCAHAGRGD